MSDEKWKNLVYQIEERFGILEKYTLEDNLEDDLGNTFPGTREVVIFEGLQGKMKLERVNHPLILEKKMHYHKGTGGTAKTEFIVSDTEKTHRVFVFVWDKTINDWKKLELPDETLRF